MKKLLLFATIISVLSCEKTHNFMCISHIGEHRNMPYIKDTSYQCNGHGDTTFLSFSSYKDMNSFYSCDSEKSYFGYYYRVNKDSIALATGVSYMYRTCTEY